jgi:hypothetical protein
VQRSVTVALHRVAVRDHVAGIEAEVTFMVGEPDLHAHTKVVEANGWSWSNSWTRMFLHTMESDVVENPLRCS